METQSISTSHSCVSLAELEDRMKRGQVDVWTSLREIHDRELWRGEGYGSFEEYGKVRWGYSRTRLKQLLDASLVYEHLKAAGVQTLPAHEAHVRPVVALRRQGRRERSDAEFLNNATFAWERAIESAPEVFDVPQITAKHVESTVERFAPAPPPRQTFTLRDVRARLTGLRRIIEQLGPIEKLDLSRLGPDFVPVLDWMISVDQERPR